MKYKITVVNPETNKKEIIEGSDVNDVLNHASRYIYDHQYGKYSYSDYSFTAANEKKYFREIKRDLELQVNQGIQESIQIQRNILVSAFEENIDVWNCAIEKVKKPFKLEWPTLKEIPPEPKKILVKDLLEPDLNSSKYTPKKKFINLIFPKKYKESVEEFKRHYYRDHKIWEEEVETINNENRKIIDQHLNLKKTIQLENEKKVNEWQEAFDNHYQSQNSEIEKLLKAKTDYMIGSKSAIEIYNKALLECSLLNNAYNDKEVQIFYNTKNKLLGVEYALPNTNDIYNIKEVKYVATRDLFIEKTINKTDYSNLYDDVILQITLRSLYEIFTYDNQNFIDSIAFNGYIKTIDRSTGHEIKPCILSIIVTKKNFFDINLKQVEFKSCFKNLKGVCATSLSTQTSIAPLLVFNKTDKRFVNHKQDMIDSIEKVNLAAMNWEDFEHLVREIFEKEFSSNGGEVKVTRSSRDGGVDAIAFDPDPIRGGKIIIQAKRYTNTVGVNAVRDLFGTVMNEGATKGILVTTSDYGADAYNFAAGKPLTLLNGSNLLYLLEKHGHKAKIDIKAAKDILKKS